MKKTIAIFCAAACAAAATRAVAQDYDAFRTKTWSVYVQGGMSWAGGVGMKNVHAVQGTGVAPLVGLGGDYNIKPWIRLGLNYEFSKFKREQRFGEFQPVLPQLNPTGDAASELTEFRGGTAYRDRWSHYHNLDLTAEFNVMEIWNRRKCKWFNLYAGTGIGGMFAKGNTYDISMGYEHWTDPAPGANNHEMLAWLKAHNSRHSFNAAYVPVLLAVEFDVMPRLTLGVKGSYKFLCSSNDFAPKNVGAVALTARYNILGPKQGYKSNRRKLREAVADYDALQAAYRTAQAECYDRQAADEVAARAQADRLKALEEENARLKGIEQENARLKAERTSVEEKRFDDFSVQFRLNSSTLTQKQLGRLLRYIETADDDSRFTIIGEANNSGDSTYNQLLSERRMNHVIMILEQHGISSERIESAVGIGATSQIDDPIARRVTIRIER